MVYYYYYCCCCYYYYYYYASSVRFMKTDPIWNTSERTVLCTSFQKVDTMCQIRSTKGDLFTSCLESMGLSSQRGLPCWLPGGVNVCVMKNSTWSSSDMFESYCCIFITVAMFDTWKHLHSSFIPYSFLRQVHILFQSEFSTEWDLVLPLSISSILSFAWGHPLTSYVFFFVFPSLLFLLLKFQKKHLAFVC